MSNGNEYDTVNKQWKQVTNIFHEASKTFLGMLKTRLKKRKNGLHHYVATYRGEAPAEEHK